MRFFDKGWCVYGFTDAPDGNAKDVETRRKFLARCGLNEDQFVCCQQVHGDQVVRVRDLSQKIFQEKDGLITDKSGIVLGVFTADCAPVVLTEPEKRVAAVVHAGWRSAAKGIVVKGIGMLRDLWGADPKKIEAHIGPCIQECCYSVGQDVGSQFPSGCVSGSEGRIFLDLPGAVALQLEGMGVLERHIAREPFCTVCGENFFSYRSNRTDQRMCAFASIK